MAMLLGAATIGYTANKVFSHKVALADPSIVDHHIEFAHALLEGDMKELEIGPGELDRVLIVKYQGKLYSVGAYCSHFAAPLSNGQLLGDKILCPLHSAAFNVVTGAIEQAPGMDGIPKFNIEEREGQFFVQVPFDMPSR